MEEKQTKQQVSNETEQHKVKPGLQKNGRQKLIYAGLASILTAVLGGTAVPPELISGIWSAVSGLF